MPERKQKKISKPWIFAVCASVVLAILTVVMASMSGVFDFADDSMTMPNVLTFSQEKASETLAELGITPSFVYVESEYTAGTVAQQSPSANTAITTKTQVKLSISTGMKNTDEPSYTGELVPDVMGATASAARDSLESLGFVVSIANSEFSETIPAGSVTRQSPLSGVRIEAGNTVSLTLSLGEAPKQYSVDVSANEGGEVLPYGVSTLEEGESITVTAEASDGWELVGIYLDGELISADESFTLANIEADHEIFIEFEELIDETPEPTQRVSASDLG